MEPLGTERVRPKRIVKNSRKHHIPMNKIILVFILLFSGTALSLSAQPAQAEEELTKLLHDFMEGASQNDAAMHDRFWAEDLIYTSSSGERFGKVEIMS